jgi:hypothetical protein
MEVTPRALYVTTNAKQKEKTFETEKTARERLPQENPRLFLAIGLAPELAPTVRGGSDRIKDTVGGQLAARSTNRRLIHRRSTPLHCCLLDLGQREKNEASVRT